jgi:hypothetical protein
MPMTEQQYVNRFKEFLKHFIKSLDAADGKKDGILSANKAMEFAGDATVACANNFPKDHAKDASQKMSQEYHDLLNAYMASDKETANIKKARLEAAKIATGQFFFNVSQNFSELSGSDYQCMSDKEIDAAFKDVHTRNESFAAYKKLLPGKKINRI